MRAVVKPGPGPGMELRDVPVPVCGPTDVLIQVHAAGVCGTDLHIWEWDAWASGRLRPPVVIGHEFAGEITALGDEAAAEGLLAVGDLVSTPLVATPASIAQGAVITGQVASYVQVGCQDCGHVSLFHAVTLGLMNP